MAVEEIKTERSGGVLTLTFNRPERANALTLDMAGQMFNVLKNATTDRGVRAVLLCGAGGNFMGGLEMDLFKGDMSKALEKFNQIITPYHSTIRELQVMDKPVLAAVDGRIEGPGMSLMLASDLVIASRDAVFNCSFTSYAMSPDGGCSYFLPRRIGLGRSVELMMLSKGISAFDAEKIGIVNRIVEDDKLHDEAKKWAAQLAEGPTKAYGAVKRLALKAFENDLNQHLGLEHTFFGQSYRSFDFREYLMAINAGRAAKFSGT